MNNDNSKRWPADVSILICFAWMSFVAWRTYARWPAIPLDLNTSDLDVQRSYRTAALMHALRAAVWGVAPPAFAYVLAWLSARRTPK